MLLPLQRFLPFDSSIKKDVIVEYFKNKIFLHSTFIFSLKTDFNTTLKTLSFCCLRYQLAHGNCGKNVNLPSTDNLSTDLDALAIRLFKENRRSNNKNKSLKKRATSCQQTIPNPETKSPSMWYRAVMRALYTVVITILP